MAFRAQLRFFCALTQARSGDLNFSQSTQSSSCALFARLFFAYIFSHASYVLSLGLNLFSVGNLLNFSAQIKLKLFIHRTFIIVIQLFFSNLFFFQQMLARLSLTQILIERSGGDVEWKRKRQRGNHENSKISREMWVSQLCSLSPPQFTASNSNSLYPRLIIMRLCPSLSTQLFTSRLGWVESVRCFTNSLSWWDHFNVKYPHANHISWMQLFCAVMRVENLAVISRTGINTSINIEDILSFDFSASCEL